MVLTVPFSVAFWVCYLCGGLSDALDGFAARKLKTQSAAGAKLDSVADLAFAAAIAVVMIGNVALPAWLCICALCVAGLRFSGYGVGLYKYHTFSSLHTYANKAAGALLFAFPLLYTLFGLSVSGIIVCAVALASALEEVFITAKSNELDRDCKGLFFERLHMNTGKLPIRK